MPTEKPPIAVLGAGSWGTALALQFARNNRVVRLWGRDKAQLEYEGALQSWRTQMAMAAASVAQVILNGLMTKPFIPAGLIAGAVAVGLGALQIAAVNKSKPTPPTFKTGGIVLGGGGSAGTAVTVAEGSSNEVLLNNSAEGQAFLGQFAEVIAEKLKGTGPNLLQLQLYMDGQKVAEAAAEYYNNGIVRVEL